MSLTGRVEVERVGGKSTVSRCFSKYPLKFIIPTKVGSSKSDAVWIYSLTYGGGIVSGDSISCDFTIGDGCTTVLTTQASTKVYKSIESKCSEQILEARIGRDALLAVIPDPVTCFSTARYSQKQIFRVTSDSNLLIVDWITSGRHQSGERWDFQLYKSTNQIFTDGEQPLFLDSILLEQGSISSISERMKDYQVLAMVVILGGVTCVSLITEVEEKSHGGHMLSFLSLSSWTAVTLPRVNMPKLEFVRNQIQQNVKKMMSEQLRVPSSVLRRYGENNSSHNLSKPDFIVSSSVFGPKNVGVVVRIAALTTESVYKFLHEQLVSLEPLLGLSPYTS